MENPAICPLEVALQKIAASAAKTQRDFITALEFLQKTVSNLLTHPNDWKYATIEKENEAFAQQLYSWREIQDFLCLIGFRLKNGVYEYVFSDEGLTILEAALKLLKAHGLAMRLNSNEKRPFFEIWQDGQYLKNSRVQVSNEGGHYEKKRDVRERRGSVQDILSRHQKQENMERDGLLLNWKKNEILETKVSSEGFFHQAGPKNDFRRRRLLNNDMFDQHDFNRRKGYGFFPFQKMV